MLKRIFSCTTLIVFLLVSTTVPAYAANYDDLEKPTTLMATEALPNQFGLSSEGVEIIPGAVTYGVHSGSYAFTVTYKGATVADCTFKWHGQDDPYPEYRFTSSATSASVSSTYAGWERSSVTTDFSRNAVQADVYVTLKLGTSFIQANPSFEITSAGTVRML